MLDRLGQTLRAAAIDETGPRACSKRGRLTEELKAVGFGPLEAVAAARAPRRRGRPAPPATGVAAYARRHAARTVRRHAAEEPRRSSAQARDS